MNLILSPMHPNHYYPLVNIINKDNSHGDGWIFNGYETAEETVHGLYTIHDNTGFFWSIFHDEVIIGFVGFYERGDEPEDGFSTKTYISSDNRGKGINQFIKNSLIELLARRGLSLYSRVNKNNVRSLHAMYKILGFGTEHSVTEDGYVIFEATKKAKERILYNLESGLSEESEEMILHMANDCLPFLENWRKESHLEDTEINLVIKENSMLDHAEVIE